MRDITAYTIKNLLSDDIKINDKFCRLLNRLKIVMFNVMKIALGITSLYNWTHHSRLHVRLHANVYLSIDSFRFEKLISRHTILQTSKICNIDPSATPQHEKEKRNRPDSRKFHLQARYERTFSPCLSDFGEIFEIHRGH